MPTRLAARERPLAQTQKVASKVRTTTTTLLHAQSPLGYPLDNGRTMEPCKYMVVHATVVHACTQPRKATDS